MNATAKKKPTVLTQAALLSEIARRRLILFREVEPTEIIEIWPTDRKLPIALRRGVTKYRAELATLLQAHDWRVCPVLLHVSYHNRKTGVCDMCQRLSFENEVIAS